MTSPDVEPDLQPPAPRPTDEVLLADFAASGDEEAFARIVGRHLSRVRATAMRVHADAASADDISQAVFVLLANRAKELSGRKMTKATGVVASFLHRATVLTALHARRAEHRRRRHERAASRPEESSAAPAIAAGDLDASVNALRDPERQVILYRFWEGLSVAETAERLRITPAAAAKRLTRAIDRLRKNLGPGVLAVLPAWSAWCPTDASAESIASAVHAAIPRSASPLPPTAVIAARAMERFALLGGAKTTAYAVAALAIALTPVLAASSLFSPTVNSAPALLAVAPAAPDTPAIELPPDSLQGDALVDWLIARNEKAVEKYKAVRYTVEHRQTFRKQPERLLRASVLLDYPRYRVDASANANRIRLGSATIVAGPDIAVVNPREYISYSHEVRAVRIKELPPGGAIHPGEQPFFLPTVITTVLRSPGTGSESLRATRARLEAKGQKLVATRSADPDTGMVRFVLTYRPSRERLSENQVVLDPARDYLVCEATSGGADLGFYSRYRIDFTTVRGLPLPTRIELVQTDKDQRVIQTQVSTFGNFSVGAPFSEADFTIAGIPIPNGASRVFTTMDGLTDREALFYSDGKWVNRQDYRRLHPAPATAPAK